MQKLAVFNHMTVDGYIADPHGDMRWAHSKPDDAEWNEFVAGNVSGGGTLLFGRVTYDMMASYWPTPMAASQSPQVAERMNKASKVVFSRTMDKASWSNTTLVKNDIAGAVRNMKAEPGEGMVILGSASIVSQLAQENLVDEFQIVVNPVVLGQGKTMFETVRQKIDLRLTNSRAFRNGNVLLSYQPANSRL